MRAASAAVGGKGGGGRPDMAQAGGPDAERAEDALDAVRALLRHGLTQEALPGQGPLLLGEDRVGEALSHGLSKGVEDSGLDVDLFDRQGLRVLLYEPEA